MSNRWLRFVIAVLALGAAGAAGYRIFQQEQRLAAHLTATRASDVAAETAIRTVSEIKAALHAFVAEGQGYAFWTSRATMLIDNFRATVLELDPAATAAGRPLTEVLDHTDRVTAAAQRALEHVRDEQRLLAGDIIFTESRDLLDAMRLQVAAARTAIAQSSGVVQGDIRREQAMLGLGAGGILAFAMLLLVIPGRASQVIPNRPVETRAPAGAQVPGKSADTPPRQPDRRESPKLPAPPAPSVLPVSLREAAAICTDLGRVSQSVEITVLLERAANVLNASGVIVWMASADGRRLHPAVSSGYDDRLLARIGSLPRDATNVTAGALRDAAPRTSSRLGRSAAALAVPLMTPLGPAGVFSAELRDITEVDETRLAVATMFAAQFASLLGSMPPIPSENTPNASSDEPTSVKVQA